MQNRMSNLLSAAPEYNRRFRSGSLMGTMAFIGNSTNYVAPMAPYIESLLSHAFELMGFHEMPPNFEAGISNGCFLGLIS